MWRWLVWLWHRFGSPERERRRVLLTPYEYPPVRPSEEREFMLDPPDEE